jgi:modulator of FtsH protease HflK
MKSPMSPQPPEHPPEPRHDPTPQLRPDPATPPGPPVVEDPGTQALAEALRSSFVLVKLFMVALVIAFIVSGVFTVAPNEVAVILRFGSPVGATVERQLRQPGLHWKFPYPIDEVVRVPVGESRTVTSTIGWFFITPEEEAAGVVPAALPSLRPGVDGYALTGDGNIVHVRTTLSYRISDPIRYAFHFVNTPDLLQRILDNSIIHTAAQFDADAALYRDKLAFQEALFNRVSTLVERVQLGVTIDPREVRTRPPLFVEDAFDSVLRAQQEGDVKVQDAQSYARGATNRAAGEASAIIRNGVTQSNFVVQTMAAETNRFLGLLSAYERDPHLFEQRMLAETTARVLTNSELKTFIPNRPHGKPWEVRVLLNKAPEVPQQTGPAEAN